MTPNSATRKNTRRRPCPNRLRDALFGRHIGAIHGIFDPARTGAPHMINSSACRHAMHAFCRQGLTVGDRVGGANSANAPDGAGALCACVVYFQAGLGFLPPQPRLHGVRGGLLRRQLQVRGCWFVNPCRCQAHWAPLPLSLARLLKTMDATGRGTLRDLAATLPTHSTP